jgi:hypothetical protein
MLGLLDPFDVSYSLIKMHTRGKYLAICLPWQAANYLDIKGLLNLTRQTITDMVMGKMTEVCKVTIQKKLSTSSTSALTTTMSSKASLSGKFHGVVSKTATSHEMK